MEAGRRQFFICMQGCKILIVHFVTLVTWWQRDWPPVVWKCAILKANINQVYWSFIMVIKGIISPLCPGYVLILVHIQIQKASCNKTQLGEKLILPSWQCSGRRLVVVAISLPQLLSSPNITACYCVPKWGHNPNTYPRENSFFMLVNDHYAR